MTRSAGIHHITAICGDPQRTVDFYSGLLGVRFVKRTVNFDDPGSYHLYFGDDRGRPGTIVTFFAWGNAPRGYQGVGQVTAIAFSVPDGSLDGWRNRLAAAGVQVGHATRFGDDVLAFQDPDGVVLELVQTKDADRRFAWHNGPVHEDEAVCGIHHATLTLDAHDLTRHVLQDALGFESRGEEGNRVRLAGGESGAGAFVDLVEAPQLPMAVTARGTVHHIAFRAEDDRAQATMRTSAQEFGVQATHVLDRQYFRSVYFREPGGILFELATDDPGFPVDEPVDHLGERLMLPPWLEPRRAELERVLPPLRPPREVTA